MRITRRTLLLGSALAAGLGITVFIGNDYLSPLSMSHEQVTDVALEHMRAFEKARYEGKPIPDYASGGSSSPLASCITKPSTAKIEPIGSPHRGENQSVTPVPSNEHSADEDRIGYSDKIGTISFNLRVPGCAASEKVQTRIFYRPWGPVFVDYHVFDMSIHLEQREKDAGWDYWRLDPSDNTLFYAPESSGEMKKSLETNISNLHEQRQEWNDNYSHNLRRDTETVLPGRTKVMELAEAGAYEARLLREITHNIVTAETALTDLNTVTESLAHKQKSICGSKERVGEDGSLKCSDGSVFRGLAIHPYFYEVGNGQKPSKLEMLVRVGDKLSYFTEVWESDVFYPGRKDADTSHHQIKVLTTQWSDVGDSQIPKGWRVQVDEAPHDAKTNAPGTMFLNTSGNVLR